MKKTTVALLALLSLNVFAIEAEMKLVAKAKEIKLNFNALKERIDILMFDGEEWESEQSINCDSLPEERVLECGAIFLATNAQLKKIQSENPDEKIAFTNYIKYIYNDDYSKEIDIDHYTVEKNDSLISVVNEELYKVSTKLIEVETKLSAKESELSQTKESNEKTKKLIKDLILQVGKSKGKKILQALSEAGVEL